MLKLIKNVVPTGAIDWTNTTFTVDKIIGAIQSVVVDWYDVSEDTSFDELSLNVPTAPSSTIVISFFYREVANVRGTGEVTLWDLVTSFYRKIGRVKQDGQVPDNIKRLYPTDYVKSSLMSSIKRITNISPEKNRVQQYAIHSSTWASVTLDPVNNSVSLEDSISSGIQWQLMLWEGVIYDYYSTDVNGVYQVKDADISKTNDKIIIGFRIPYGVEKITNVSINSCNYSYTHENEFNINTKDKFTVTKDFQWNEYIFLPYSEEVVTAVVKYTPNADFHQTDEDVIDIPREYGDLFVYDTAYRLLRDREDDRWMTFKQEVWTGSREWLLFEYQNFIKSKIKKPRTRIGFASTY